MRNERYLKLNAINADPLNKYTQKYGYNLPLKSFLSFPYVLKCIPNPVTCVKIFRLVPHICLHLGDNEPGHRRDVADDGLRVRGVHQRARRPAPYLQVKAAGEKNK